MPPICGAYAQRDCNNGRNNEKRSNFLFFKCLMQSLIPPAKLPPALPQAGADAVFAKE
jgi:hypothetical protein